MVKYYPFKTLFTEGISYIRYREPFGHVELSVSDTGTASALDLVEQLAVSAAELPATFKAEDLVVADRDRLLAAIYTCTHGPKIESTVQCPYCNELVDTDFDLHAFQHHLLGMKSGGGIIKREDNRFELPGGYLFRLPTGGDELIAAQFLEDQAIDLLLEKCLIEKPEEVNSSLVQEAMERVAPILESDMEVLCRECGREHTAHFCIQSFLLSKFIGERKQVIKEIHSIASNYHWAYDDILNLPRSIRKNYFELIER